MSANQTTITHSYTPRGAARDIFARKDAEVLLAGPAGTGKAQPVDSVVYTHTGARRIGDLCIGDYVCTPDGALSKIIDIPFEGMSHTWKILFSDGSVVSCSEDHLWEVNWRDSESNIQTGVLSTTEILKRMHENRGRNTFFVSPAIVANFSTQDVPINPYVLGVLLGDGHIREDSISFTSADMEIINRVDDLLPENHIMRLREKYGNSAIHCAIMYDRKSNRMSTGTAKKRYISRTGSGKWMARVRLPGENSMNCTYLGSYETQDSAQHAIDSYSALLLWNADKTHTILDDIDMLGLGNSRSDNKFIPDIYKINSREVRLNILRGLMDTDGTIGKQGDVTFTSVSEKLANDVAWLVESLGGITKTTNRITKYTYKGEVRDGKRSYTVHIRYDDTAELFTLTRKRVRSVPRLRALSRWIINAEYVGEVQSRCISIEAPSGLYLTNNFISTHNSLAALEKLNALALKYPNMRGLIVRKTQVSLPSSALSTWRKLVIPELLKAKYVLFHGGGPQDPPQYRYANGSTINVGGLDKASKIMSTEYDIVYVQEATELVEDDWEAINTRLRSWVIPYQQIIADCNPAQPTHWLNLRCQADKTLMLHSKHEDNPALYNDDGTMTPHGKEYLAKLDNLTGVRYLRLRKGIWAAAEGVIYDTWDDNLHMVDPFIIPREWRRYWAVDFGFTHPFVLQCWAEDPDGRLYRYREIFKTQTLVEDHAKKILSIVRPEGRWLEPQPTAIICDHDAEGRATLEKYLGMSTVPAKKVVTEGIQAVQSRLTVQKDGKPRLFLVRGALVEKDTDLVDAKRPTCTEEEIPGYVWAPGKDGSPAKEEPVKDMDDGCLVAGTMITTDNGDIAIEYVVPGMYVLTRNGYCLVTDSGITSCSASVLSIHLSNGTSLTGTGNHPVLADGHWVRLDALRYGDRLHACTLRQQHTIETDSALTNVKQHGDVHQVLTMKKGNVRSAESFSQLVGTVNHNAVDVYVLNIEEQDIRVPVYNLTVAGSHEYFSNGVLVHNCDTLRYVVAQVDLVGRPRIRSFSPR